MLTFCIFSHLVLDRPYMECSEHSCVCGMCVLSLSWGSGWTLNMYANQWITKQMQLDACKHKHACSKSMLFMGMTVHTVIGGIHVRSWGHTRTHHSKTLRTCASTVAHAKLTEDGSQCTSVRCTPYMGDQKPGAKETKSQNIVVAL